MAYLIGEEKPPKKKKKIFTTPVVEKKTKTTIFDMEQQIKEVSLHSVTRINQL